MTFLKKVLSSSVESGMKTIVYRGGVVTFRVPAHWREESSDMDGGVFYEDRADSGTLRLKVITVATPKELEAGSAIDILRVAQNGLKRSNVEGTIMAREDGNALFRYEDSASEQGRALTIFYWMIANPVPPHHARVVTFSYTVLAEHRNEPELQRGLAMLEAEIEAARFSPELGAVSG
jgi:hypothetical protein